MALLAVRACWRTSLAAALVMAGCLDVEREASNRADLTAETVTGDTASGDGGPVGLCSLDSDCEGLVALTACQRPDCQNGLCVAVADSEGGPCTSEGSLCSLGTCSDGLCTNLVPLDCSSLDAFCVAGKCNADSGQCEAVNLPSGTDCAQEVCQRAFCDDGGVCVDEGPPVGEACSTEAPCLVNGTCTVTGVCDESWDTENCPCVGDSDCDDGVDCTVGACDEGTCFFTPYDTVCAINGLCYFKGESSTLDPCAVCAPAISQSAWSIRSCSDDNPCTVDSCDPENGCQFDEDAADGQACADGPACGSEVLGTCNAGVCEGCDLECSLSAQCELAPTAPTKGECEKFKCDEGKCLVVPNDSANGQACDTGDPCTENGVCSNGACIGQPVVCAPKTCAVGTCEPAEQGGFTCTYLAEAVGSPCDDGDPCSIGDACQEQGQCLGQALDCSAFTFGPCLLGACDAGSCKSVPAVDGITCDLAVDCSQNDTCKDGICTAGEVTCSCSENAECDDGLDCTFDICDSGTCAFQVKQDTCLIDGICYDREVVNVTNPCVECGDAPTAWSPIECADGNPCTDDSCDPDNGGCVFTVDVTNPCNDGDPCSADDQCDASGACVGTCECDAEKPCEGEPPPCSKWSCENNVCLVVPDGTLNGADCDDGDFCTVADSCQTGQCAGTPRDCSDAGDGSCVIGQCDEAAAACVGVNSDEGASCDDSDPCTQQDACNDSGGCVGAPRDCSDADALPCLVGECVGGSCVGQPQAGLGCDDGEACTLEDRCDALGACVGQWDTATEACGCNANTDCASLATACKDAFCDTQTHECYTAPKSGSPPCDDGVACTQDDLCQPEGACSGTPYLCSDDLTCTNDVCDG